MMPAIDLAKKLADPDGKVEVSACLSRWEKERRVDEAVALLHVLITDQCPVEVPPPIRVGYGVLIGQALGIRFGLDGVKALLDIFLHPAFRPLDRHQAELACLVAFNHGPDTLERFFKPRPLSTALHDEFLLMLAQEWTLRYGRVDREGIVEFVHQHATHPLAWLPLLRHDIEKGMRLPTFFAPGNVGYTGDLANSEAGYQSAARKFHLSAGIRLAPERYAEEEGSQGSAEFLSAVREWEEKESCVFRLDPALFQSVPTADVALSLPAPALLSIQEEELACGLISPERAVQLLFFGACFGRPYGGRWFGAYSRLYVWQSLAAMVQIPMSAGVAAVADRVSRCEWFEIRPRGDFFTHEDLFDLALVGLSPERSRIAGVFATGVD